MKIRLGDGVIIISYIAVLSFSMLSMKPSGDILTVQTEGGTFAYSLSEDGVYSFSGPLGMTEIEIRNGRARIISSPCRNGICMDASWSDTLCCLPNRIIATTTEENGDMDAISG